MQSSIQEVYRQQILPLDEKERLKLVALIINDISQTNRKQTATRKARAA